MTAEQQLERSVLERKEREELRAIAQAMSLDTNSRSKKADIIDQILRAAGVEVSAGSANGGADAPHVPPAVPAGVPRPTAMPRRSSSTVDASQRGRARDARAPTAARRPRPRLCHVVRGRSQVDVGPTCRNRRRRRLRPTSPRTSPPVASRSTEHDGAGSVGGPGAGDLLARAAARVRTRIVNTCNRAGQSANEPGNRRGRRRRGRERTPGPGGGGGGERELQGGGQEPSTPGELIPVSGLLDLRDEGYGFLRAEGYLPSSKDVYISISQARRFAMRRGDFVEGACRPAASNEKFPALIRIDSVSGLAPDEARNRPRFEDLTPLFPDEKLRARDARVRPS